ncbi:hypothetical protein ACRC7T_04035 [Segnochrobactraceae bacterium EtOH-i3]
MTCFLILPDEAAADARSRSAWAPGPGDTITTHRWGWRVHPTDGRAALMIPDGDEAAHLTGEEVAALVDRLSEDWTPPE